MLASNSVLGRIVRLPLAAIPPDSEILVLSGANRGRRWVVGSGVHGYWIGCYERQNQRFISEHVKPGMTVFDVGAQAGFFTLLMSKLVGRNGRVYAFEPDPLNIKKLRRNLQINDISNVTIVEAAASDKNGQAFFQRKGASAGRLAETGDPTKTVRLDTFTPPDFVKMDIEGGETLALHGAAAFLQARMVTWLVATHNKELHQSCLALLSSHVIEELAPHQIAAFP